MLITYLWIWNRSTILQRARWRIAEQFGCLTDRGRVTHICVGNLTIIGPDNGLAPGRRQAIIWTNAGILLIGPWGTNFSEILIGIHAFSFKKIYLKMSSAKWRPFCRPFHLELSCVRGILYCNSLRNQYWSARNTCFPYPPPPHPHPTPSELLFG